jgi:hypothetical protein
MVFWHPKGWTIWQQVEQYLRRMLDETEFLSDYGVRAISRIHKDHPYTFHWDNQSMTVEYQPGESTSGIFGGNSNWRGPIWFPVNYLIIESLQKFHHYYGDEFKVECPTGSGHYLTLNDCLILIITVYPYHITTVLAQFVIDTHISGDISCILTRVCFLQLKITSDCYADPVVEKAFRNLYIQVCLIGCCSGGVVLR